MSRSAVIFESRAASERSLTTNFSIPLALLEDATSPDEGRLAPGLGFLALVAGAVATPGTDFSFLPREFARVVLVTISYSTQAAAVKMTKA